MSSAMRLFEALARADASTGWTVMIGAGAWCDLAGLPRPSFDALFANGPDVIVAGVFNPSGTHRARPTRATCVRAVGVRQRLRACRLAVGQLRRRGLDGGPQLRVAVFSPDQVVIEDTWNVAGLRGTGSHHFHVDESWSMPAGPAACSSTSRASTSRSSASRRHRCTRS